MRQRVRIPAEKVCRILSASGTARLSRSWFRTAGRLLECNSKPVRRNLSQNRCTIRKGSLSVPSLLLIPFFPCLDTPFTLSSSVSMRIRSWSHSISAPKEGEKASSETIAVSCSGLDKNNCLTNLINSFSKEHCVNKIYCSSGDLVSTV